MAQARRGELHQDLTGLRCVELDLFDLIWDLELFDLLDLRLDRDRGRGRGRGLGPRARRALGRQQYTSVSTPFEAAREHLVHRSVVIPRGRRSHAKHLVTRLVRLAVEQRNHRAHCVVARVVRDVDALDPCGVYFGTTGGQVYASADAGDRWAPIVRDLPSVVSVEVQTLP